MPPTPRGRLFLSIIRRHASTKVSSKNTVTSNVKATSKPKAPLPHRHPRTNTYSPNVSQKSAQLDSESLNGEFLQHFVRHPQYRKWRTFLLVVPSLAVAWMHFPYEILPVSGNSMTNSLNLERGDNLSDRDHILVRHSVGLHANSEDQVGEAGKRGGHNTELKRGQLVIFSVPHKPERIAIKRVVAIPGDLVQPLPEYAGGDGPVAIPWNHIWVEGDAGRKKDSMDSNWYGPITQNLVLGEVQAVWTSFWKLKWIDWRQHTWPAREQGRVEEDAITEATVNPDAVYYSEGWRNGSIALILQRLRTQPEKALYAFVHDPKKRQETRRLYNNALYVADVANSERERNLAADLLEEMQDLYGREALIYGLRLKKQPRDRGELPNTENLRVEGSTQKDEAAFEAEQWLRKQGWELERAADGTVRTQPRNGR